MRRARWSKVNDAAVRASVPSRPMTLLHGLALACALALGPAAPDAMASTTGLPGDIQQKLQSAYKKQQQEG